jgi:Skp family chaperone for outer membrane proteins
MGTANGRAIARGRARAWCSGRAGRALALLAAVGTGLMLASVASASARSYTWAGRSTVSEDWSYPANWEGDEAPPAAANVGVLEFPRLTSTACTSEPATHPCYVSTNDLSGLSAESVKLDDGDSYFIEGEPLRLGADGLSAAPGSGSSEPAGDFIFMPLQLTAPQKWSITERASGAVEENGMFLVGALTGPSALSVELSEGPALILANETEVGPLTLEGPNASGEHIDNGSVILEEAALNSADGEAVSLRHLFLAGTGAVGALTTDDSTLDIGSDTEPAEGLEASSVKLDSASVALFEIMGSGSVAQDDYSQLTARGRVELAGSIAVLVGKPSKAASCPVLTPGQTYTLVSTTGTLSGTFANATEGGPEITVDYAASCSQRAQTMRIGYHRGGGTETVTGTVEAASVQHQEEEQKRHEEEAAKQKKTQEEDANQVHKEEAEHEEAIKKLQAELAKKAGEETAIVEAKRKGEEEAAAAKRHQEETAKSEVLGVKEGSPDAGIASTSLQASASGAVRVKVSCPAVVGSCSGTVSLRTLQAVSADVGAAAASRRAILTLASGSFDVPGGQVKLITLHLSAKARALLARLHTLRVRATVMARNPSGATHLTDQIATLRAAKPKHA